MTKNYNINKKQNIFKRKKNSQKSKNYLKKIKKKIIYQIHIKNILKMKKKNIKNDILVIKKNNNFLNYLNIKQKSQYEKIKENKINVNFRKSSIMFNLSKTNKKIKNLNKERLNKMTKKKNIFSKQKIKKNNFETNLNLNIMKIQTLKIKKKNCQKKTDFYFQNKFKNKIIIDNKNKMYENILNNLINYLFRRNISDFKIFIQKKLNKNIINKKTLNSLTYQTELNILTEFFNLMNLKNKGLCKKSFFLQSNIKEKKIILKNFKNDHFAIMKQNRNIKKKIINKKFNLRKYEKMKDIIIFLIHIRSFIFNFVVNLKNKIQKVNYHCKILFLNEKTTEIKKFIIYNKLKIFVDKKNIFFRNSLIFEILINYSKKNQCFFQNNINIVNFFKFFLSDIYKILNKKKMNVFLKKSFSENRNMLRERKDPLFIDIKDSEIKKISFLKKFKIRLSKRLLKKKKIFDLNKIKRKRKKVNQKIEKKFVKDNSKKIIFKKINKIFFSLKNNNYNKNRKITIKSNKCIKSKSLRTSKEDLFKKKKFFLGKINNKLIDQTKKINKICSLNNFYKNSLKKKIIFTKLKKKILKREKSNFFIK